MLKAFGVRIVDVDLIPFQGFLFDADDDSRGYGVIKAKPLVDGAEPKAIRYMAPMDSAVLQALQTRATALAPTPYTFVDARPTLIETTSDELMSRLKKYVKPYGQVGISLNINRVPVKSLISLSKVVKGYKYHQIGYLQQLFVRYGLTPFQLALVKYPNGSSTILTPAVVESSGGQHILIQGNTRGAFCQRKGIEQLECVVVQNVSVPLPSDQRIPVRHMLIGGRTLSTQERYGTDIDKDYRQIELAAHYPQVTLV
jgi:hypothetical protein